MRWMTAFLVLLLLAIGCNDRSSELSRTMPTRPVSVIILTEQSFLREQEMTGVVTSYREEDVAFEVSGRVTMVLDEGLEVRGPAFNENGEQVRRGDPIAVVDNTRYGIQVGALSAKLDVARRNLDSAQAKTKLARQTLSRQKQVLVKGLVTQQTVDDAQSAFDQATAQVAAYQSEIESADQQLNQAVKDLGDAVLYAPFSGRITKSQTSEGAVVSTGSPVATLTLMDPIQIQVEVSADAERKIATGDHVTVYATHPYHPEKRLPVSAVVYEKSAVADPLMRTFRIVLMLRNTRFHVHQDNPKFQGLPVINEYLPAIREFQGENGPLFIPTEALLEDSGKMYVLRLPKISLNQNAFSSAVGKHLPERVPVILGNSYTSVVKWNFRSVKNTEAIAEGDFLILNPVKSYLDGVLIGRPEWLFRPRGLVSVRFSYGEPQKGLYVPNHAIININETPHVYRVENGKAVATPVSLFDRIGESQRIEGVKEEVEVEVEREGNGEGLVAGHKIIVGGVHYISNNQPVTVSEVLPQTTQVVTP
ncbi:efflux RND transporter periplasmic adaptor subunit [Vibrio profundum]|uniref:efflux RND transporter periplasmic adaptor subunit n=1 Tax=Vibrio profundum TaxID=2910247 RepID=UPI003D147DA3